MNNPYKTIEYRGRKIEIFYDDDAQTPKDWGDTGAFLVGFHKDFWVEVEGFGEDRTKNIMRWQMYRKAAAVDEGYLDDARLMSKEYWVFPVYAYIHSGVSLSVDRVGQHADRWDSACVGAAYVKRNEAKSRVGAHKIAEGLTKTWNTVLAGEVYGYSTGTDSCWGFYGDPEESGLMDAAKESIDFELAKEQVRHERKLKAQIINHVPISKRS